MEYKKAIAIKEGKTEGKIDLIYRRQLCEFSYAKGDKQIRIEEDFKIN